MTNMFGNHILFSSIKVLHQLACLRVDFLLTTSNCLHIIQIHLQVVIPPHGSHESTTKRFLGCNIFSLVSTTLIKSKPLIEGFSFSRISKTQDGCHGFLCLQYSHHHSIYWIHLLQCLLPGGCHSNWTCQIQLPHLSFTYGGGLKLFLQSFLLLSYVTQIICPPSTNFIPLRFSCQA